MSVLVSGGESSQAEPNTMKMVSMNNTSASLGTYYTVANITGKGKLKRVSAYVQGNYTNANLKIRLTIDGGTPFIIGVTEGGGTTASMSRGFGGWNNSASGYIQNYTDILTNLSFNTSLLVEVMQNSNTLVPLDACIDYNLI
jgi:hypothetical protein